MKTLHKIPGPLAAVLLLVTLCVVGPVGGEDRNGDGVDDDAVRVLSGRASCDGCEPRSVRIELVFDREVDPNAVAVLTDLEPPVRLVPLGTGPSRNVQLQGPFAPATQYRLSIAANADLGSHPLAAAYELSFATGGGYPQMLSPYGEVVISRSSTFPVFLENVPRARVRVARLGPADLAAAAAIGGVHWDQDPVASLPAGLRGRMREQSITGGDVDVDVFDLAGGSPALVVVDAPGLPARAAIVQHDALSLTLKVGPTNGLVWVVDPSTGRAVSGADVRVYEGSDLRLSGRTDAQGLLRLPSSSRLRRSTDEEWARPALRAVVAKGSELAYASEHFTTGIETWQYGIPYHGGGSSLTGMVTAERGIYRPGETVHLLGVLRRRGPNGRLVAPRGAVEVEVSDPDGTRVTLETIRPTAFGTFRLDVPIARGSRLGSYFVRAKLAGSSREALSHRFDVGEFRANTFEVEIAASGEAEWEADTLVVPVSAAYLYGAPVGGGTVRYTVSTRERRLQVPGFEHFDFSSAEMESARYLTGGELTLDAQGRGRIEIDRAALPNDEHAPQSLDVIVEATVTDEADDTVTARTAQSVAAVETLVGIKNDRWVARTGDRWTVELLAVGADERPVAGRPLEVSLYRRVWRTAAEAGHGGVRYDGEWEEVLVETKSVASGDRPVRASFDLRDGGEYWIEAGSVGRSQRASASIWVADRSSYGPVYNHPRIDLVLDRPSYEPGDTARVYAMSPYAESLALVTVERDGILEARTTTLHGTETPIAIDVGERHLPNAFVGVTLLPIGRAGAEPASGIPLRSGYAELRVSPETRRLDVEIVPTSRELEPGDEAEVIVRVKDHARRPVRAEVTLWAADEGVLQLTGYRTPDPFEPAYASQPLLVRTANNLARWSELDAHEWYDEGGDSGGEGGSALRSRFLSTAFFSRGVITGADGTARVRMRLPDNLTRWRVMGAAADTGDRFGSGESSITARKELQVTPALPRFLTEGDLVDASVVVHNHTGSAGTARVTLEVAGAELAGPSEQSIELADGERQSVRFTVLGRNPGTATFRARTSLGGEQDGFELALPVHPATAWNTAMVGDGRIEGTASAEVVMPAGAKPGTAELIVTLSPSVLASLDSGVQSLIDYPNGCLEQTTSGLIPMLLLADLVSGSAAPMLEGPEHRARMNDAIAHVLTHQNEDGGFGLWPSSESEGFLTAYGLWGLITAREHGYDVPDARVTRAIAYLRTHTGHGTDMHGQFNDAETEPFAAYVLARADQGNRALSTSLASREASLSRFSVALVANALGSDGSAPLFTALERAEIAARDGKMIDEAGPAGFMEYGSDLRATSSAVQALVAAGRTSEAEDLVAGILAARDPSGSWGSTYNNLWALYALSSFAEAVQERDGPATVTVTLGGENIGTVRVGGARSVERIVVSGDRLPAPGSRLTLALRTTSGTTARYSARLRYVPQISAQRAEEHGLRVTRDLLDADTGRAVTTPRVGQLLRVRLTLHVEHAMQQVALTDRLPAGFEPVDTSLATTERRAVERGETWVWTHREIHDERVAYFANHLWRGTHRVEYLARANRSGEFVRPAPTTEAMYDPRIWGRGEIERVRVTR
jgi:hypothetical protein